MKYPTTTAQARALPELPEGVVGGLLGLFTGAPKRFGAIPIEGDSIVLFTDTDGTTKEPFEHQGKLYKRPADI